MSIKILNSALLTTVQDLGRYGFQKYGIIVSGAMDEFSFRIANLLVGNKENAPALEIMIQGPTIEILEDTLLAISGGNLSPKINGEFIPLWRTIFVKKGSIINFGSCISGAIAYLAVAGGFAVEEVMGSRSTYLRAGLGGFNGRVLKKQDILKFNNSSNKIFKELKYAEKFKLPGISSINNNTSFIKVNWFLSRAMVPSYTRNYKDGFLIRVMIGREFERFSLKSREEFFREGFEISPRSDRMGYRLKGPNLKLSKPLEMLSQAVAVGTIQVPPEGNPIVLLADRQTVGGYPRIAEVASVDIPLMAQLKPMDKLYFKVISLEEAQGLYIEREIKIKQLKQGIFMKGLKNYV